MADKKNNYWQLSDIFGDQGVPNPQQFLSKDARAAKLGKTVFPFTSSWLTGPGAVRVSDFAKAVTIKAGLLREAGLGAAANIIELASSIPRKTIEEMAKNLPETEEGSALWGKISRTTGMSLTGNAALRKKKQQAEELAQSVIEKRPVFTGMVVPENIGVLGSRFTIESMLKNVIQDPANFFYAASGKRNVEDMLGGLKTTWSKRAYAITSKALGQLPGNEGLLNYYRTWRVGASSAFEAMVADRNLDQATKSKLQTEFLKYSWKQTTDPIISALTDTSKIPTTMIGPRLLSNRAIRASSLTDLFGDRRIMPEEMMAHAAGFMAENARVGPFKSIHKLGDSGDRIRQALQLLDDQEEVFMKTHKLARGPLYGHSAGIANRVATFDRVSFRFQEFLKGNPTASISYQFDPGDIRSGAPMGIHITVAKKGIDVVRPGMEESAAQVFMPVQGFAGEIMTKSGSHRIGINTAVSTNVLRHSRAATLWDKRMWLVSQDLWKMSNLDPENALTDTTDFRKLARARAATNRVARSGNLHIFSFQEMLGASLASRLNPTGRTGRMFATGDFKGVQKELELGISEAFGEYSQPYKLGSPQRSALWSYINKREWLLRDPRDISALSRTGNDSVDFDALKNFIESGEGANDAGMRAVRNEIISRYGGDVELAAKSIGQQSIEATANMHNSIIDLMSEAGLDASGQKAGAGFALSKQSRNFFLPGGTPSIRPQQWFNSIGDARDPLAPAAAEAHPRATTNFMTNAGYEEINNTELFRNARVGFIMGGTTTGADGKTVEMGEAAASDWLGAREQQIVMKREFQSAFGEGANLTDAKIMTGISKGMVQLTGPGGLEIMDDALDIISGNPISKVMGKHQSGGTIWEGIFNRLLENPDNRGFVSEQLMKVFGDDTLDIKLNPLNNQHIITWKRPPIFGAENEIDPAVSKVARRVDMPELMGIVDRYNAANSTNPLNLVRDVKVRNAGGAVATMRVLDLLMPTRVLQKSAPGYDVSPRDQLYSNEPLPFSRGYNSSNLPIDQLERFQLEGAFYHAADYHMRGLMNPTQGRYIQDFREHKSAFFSTFKTPIKMQDGEVVSDMAARESLYDDNRLEADAFSNRSISASEIADRPTGKMTPSEYSTHYGTDFHEVRLPGTVTISGEKVSSLFMPSQSPTPTEDGMFQPTRLQSAMNKVVKATPENLTSAVYGYRNALQEQFAKTVDSAWESVKVEGPGVGRFILKQDIWAGTDQAMRPGEMRISEDIARRNLGLDFVRGGQNRTVRWDAERNMNYFYTTSVRAPDITTGRQVFKAYIDPELKETAAYGHRMDMKLLYGDSDGDTVAWLVANASHMDGKYKLSPEAAMENHAQLERNIQVRQKMWDEVLSNRDPLTMALRGASIETPMNATNENIASILAGLHKDNPIQSAKSVAEQQMYEAPAQGLMGSTARSIQDYFAAIALAPDPERYSNLEREIAAGLYGLVGETRELVLKTAKSGFSGNAQFNPFVYRLLIRNKSDAGSSPLKIEEDEVDIPDMESRYFSKGKNNEWLYKGENAEQYFNKAFASEKTKSIAGQEGMQLLGTFIGDSSVKDANWYKHFEGTSPTYRAAAHGDIESLAQTARQFAAMQRGEIDAESAELLGPGGRFMREALMATINEPVHNPGGKPFEFQLQMFARAAGESAQETATNMLDSVKGNTGKALNFVAEHKTWAGIGAGAIAALGAGAIIYRNSANTRPESMGQSDRAPAVDNTYHGAPDAPRPPMGGRTRVMDNRPGSGAQSFNVRIKARNAVEKAIEHSEVATNLSKDIGGSLAVSVRDERSSADDNEQEDFRNQLKGR